MVDAIYLWVVGKRQLSIRLFWIVTIALLILIAFGYRAIVVSRGDWFIYYEIGKKAADIAVLFLVATVIPGIARRFKISHKFIMILMLFRRQLGIATFMFALVHVSFITIFPEIRAHVGLIATDPRNLAGWGTFILLIPLFLTSNDLSVRKLGVWWHRIHALTYGVLFVLVAHAFFAEMSWFLLACLAALIEIVSFLVARFRRQTV